MKLAQFVRTHLLAHKFVRDTATLQAGTIAVLACNLAGVVLLAHVLGASAQGQYYVAITLYSLLWFLLNPGVVAATVTQVAAANARGLHDKAAAWLAFLAKAQLALGLALVVLGVVLLPWIVRVVEPDDAAAARFYTQWGLVMCATPLLELPRVVACAALQATRTMLPFARVETGQELVRVFLVVALAIATHSPAGPVAGTLLASAFGSWIAIEQYRAARQAAPERLPSLRTIAAHVRDVPMRAGLTLGFKLGVCRSMDAAANQLLPTLLMQRYASTEWVAYLRIAQRLTALPQLFMQALQRTLMPRLSELAGEQHRDRFRATFVRGSLYSGLLTCGALALLFPLLPYATELGLPRDYAAPIQHIAWILAPGLAVLSFSIANESFYLVTNQLRVLVVSCVLGLVVTGLAQWQLARSVPDTGVAWGLTVTCAWSLTHYAYFAWYWRRGARRTPGAQDAPSPGGVAPVLPRANVSVERPANPG